MALHAQSPFVKRQSIMGSIQGADQVCSHQLHADQSLHGSIASQRQSACDCAVAGLDSCLFEIICASLTGNAALTGHNLLQGLQGSDV